MKKLLLFAAILVSLFAISCGSPSSKPVPTDGIYVSGKIMRRTVAERLRDTAYTDPKIKIQTSLLALFNQYVANDSSFVINPDSVLEGDVFIPSLVRFKGGPPYMINVYIYQNPDSAVGRLRQSGPGSLDSMGVNFESYDTSRNIYQAEVPIDSLEAIAENPLVRHIAFITDPIRWSVATEMTHSAEALNIAPSVIDGKSKLSGVKIGVISDDCGSYESELLLKASKDNHFLNQSATAVLDGSKIRTHEGLAMMEVVQQIVPSATVMFATGTTGLSQFHNSIRRLADEGCKIIVDDLLYLEEPAFSDGPLCRTIQQVIDNDSVIYVSSAGNFAKDVYTFQFNPVEDVRFGRLEETPVWGTVHRDVTPYLNNDFSIAPGQTIQITLQWDDGFGASTNNFDLHLVDVATGIIITSSIDAQGPGLHADPYEMIYYKGNNCWGSKGYKLEIVRREHVVVPGDNRTPRMKLLMLGFGDDPTHVTKDQSIFGHTCYNNVISCAAMPAGGTAITAEDWSSRGAADIVQTETAADEGLRGMRPIAVSRLKPDIAAVNGISTSVANYAVFGGTSASAPVVAGVIGLMMAAEPTAQRYQILQALKRGCIDYDARKDDNIVGRGRIDAFKCAAELKAALHPGEYFCKFSSNTTGSPPTATAVGVGISLSSLADVKVGEMFTLITIDGYTGSDPVTFRLNHASAYTNVVEGGAYTYVNLVIPGTTVTSAVTTFNSLGISGAWGLIGTIPPSRVRDFGVFVKKG